MNIQAFLSLILLRENDRLISLHKYQHLHKNKLLTKIKFMLKKTMYFNLNNRIKTCYIFNSP